MEETRETTYQVRASADEPRAETPVNPLLTPEDREPVEREVAKETPEFQINKDLSDLSLPAERRVTREISNVDFSPHSNMFDQQKEDDEKSDLELDEKKDNFEDQVSVVQNETIINVDTKSGRDPSEDNYQSPRSRSSERSDRPALNKESYKQYLSPDIVKFAKKSNRGDMTL